MDIIERINDAVLFSLIFAGQKIDSFLNEDERGGAEIVAMIVLIGVVIAVAAIFRGSLIQKVGNLLDTVFAEYGS